MRERMLQFILTQVPVEFGRADWLGVKMSPHTAMIFINRVEKAGIQSNFGFFTWNDCRQEIISTVYQRLKLNEKLHGEKRL